jgi:hypothetical protein
MGEVDGVMLAAGEVGAVAPDGVDTEAVALTDAVLVGGCDREGLTEKRVFV